MEVTSVVFHRRLRALIAEHGVRVADLWKALEHHPDLGSLLHSHLNSMLFEHPAHLAELGYPEQAVHQAIAAAGVQVTRSLEGVLAIARKVGLETKGVGNARDEQGSQVA